MDYIKIEKEKIRTLLEVLNKAEYEFRTSENLCVTDRPDLDPNDVKWVTNFQEIIKLIDEQLSLWEKLVDNHTNLSRNSTSSVPDFSS